MVSLHVYRMVGYQGVGPLCTGAHDQMLPDAVDAVIIPGRFFSVRVVLCACGVVDVVRSVLLCVMAVVCFNR